MIASAFAVAACGGDDSAVSDASPATTLSAPATTDQTTVTTDDGGATTTGATTSDPASVRIPDGTYRRVATVADGVARGLDEEVISGLSGEDGVMPVAFRIDGPRFELLVTNDADIEEVGTAGTYRYEAPSSWILVEDCCGDLPLYWAYADGVLTITVPDDFIDEGVYIFEGEWVLDTGAAEPASSLTLTFANPLGDLPPQILPFAVEVRERSEEAIEFDAVFEAGTEAEIVASLLDGSADIAWVGTRALTEFDPLRAPFLVDSYELQEAVFDAGLVDRMAERLADRGLIALAVYPGPMRKMVGVDEAFLGPEDYVGTAIATGTPLGDATITALGATPRPSASGMSLDGLDGFEFQLAAIVGNGYEEEVAAVTANVNFWPRPLALIMSVERFEALTDEQRDILVEAATSTYDRAAEATRQEDLDAADGLCASAMEVLQASDEDLTGLRQAVEPVYASIRAEAVASALLDEIAALKADLGAPPATLRCQ